MHAYQILAASLAIVPSVFAQSTTPAQSPALLNGFYNIISAGDGTVLTLDSREGVFALRYNSYLQNTSHPCASHRVFRTPENTIKANQRNTATLLSGTAPGTSILPPPATHSSQTPDEEAS